MTRAAAWSVPFLVMLFLSARVVAGIARSRWVEQAVRDQLGGYSGEPHPPPPYLLWLLVVGGSCWAVCTAAEVSVARTLAAGYPSLGPLAWVPGSALPHKLRRAVGNLDRKLGNVGGGCLGVAALAAAGPLVVLLWSLFTATAIALWVLAVLGATAGYLLAARSRVSSGWDRRVEGR